MCFLNGIDFLELWIYEIGLLGCVVMILLVMVIMGVILILVEMRMMGMLLELLVLRKNLLVG